MSGIEAGAPAITGAVRSGLAVLWSSIRSRYKSSQSLKEIYDQLNSDLKILLALKSDKEKEVLRHQEKETTSAYNLWIQRVSEIVVEGQKLKTKYDTNKLSKRHIQQRSRLSEEMKKVCHQVQKLIEEGRLKDFLVDKLPESVVKELDVPQIGQYPTLHNSLESILCLLKSVKIKAIGVWGNKGVGKTTLMQNLNNNEEVAKMFDRVIF